MRVIEQAIDALKAHPWIRRVRYARRNSAFFSDIFWHDAMLADGVRMSVYQKAIAEVIRPGMRVLDVGTGSGVLACLAAARGAQVVAIEHSPLIERAKVLAAHNGVSNRIRFERTHSRGFRDAQGFDVILHEQIGMNLVDEDMVENLSDLRRRLLRPGGRVLPAKFQLRAQPVSLRPEKRIPFLHEQHIGPLDFSCFRGMPANPGYDRRTLSVEDVGRSLAPAATLFSLDLDRDEGAKIPSRCEADFILEAGQVDGVVVDFACQLTDQVGFVAGPGHPRTHWECTLYRTEVRVAEAGAFARFVLEPTVPTNPKGWRWGFTMVPAPAEQNEAEAKRKDLALS